VSLDMLDCANVNPQASNGISMKPNNRFILLSSIRVVFGP
jgi:hypothetical protein